MNDTEVISYCMMFKNVYQDLPFRDEKQMVICHRSNRKVFAWFYETDGQRRVRFRCHEEKGEQWIRCYKSIEKDHWDERAKWLSLLLDEDNPLPEEVLKEIITESYEITKPGEKRKSSSWYFK